MKATNTHTALRAVPGACERSRSLSYNCLLQDKDLIHRPSKLKQRSGFGEDIEGVGSPLHGTAWSPYMGSQPCLGRRLPSDWPSWPGLEQGSSSQALQPEPRTVSLPPSALMPFSFQSLLLSLAFLLSPSPPQAWPSPPHPCLGHFST